MNRTTYTVSNDCSREGISWDSAPGGSLVLVSNQNSGGDGVERLGFLEHRRDRVTYFKSPTYDYVSELVLLKIYANAEIKVS